MAQQFDTLQSGNIDFIEQQKLYFVGSAGAEGFVNVSPKGMDSLRVLSPSRLIWLNLTGSGNETAAHVLENGRMTIMFCSFEKKPLILRVYGSATLIYPHHDNWAELAEHFPRHSGARQIYSLAIELVQTSCGFAVPFFDFAGERDTLINWADQRDQTQLEAYWRDKNTVSMNGKPTGIFGEPN